MRIGIDLGGTKIEGVVLDDSGTERRRQRVPTPGNYVDTMNVIAALVRTLEAAFASEDDGVATVGIGIPGAVTANTGLVKNANSVWLIGKPLVQDLTSRLGREVRVMNDADCFALSEATDGAGAGAPIVFGVILGTGVGGGVVVHGRNLQGPNLITGEWGHNPLPWPREDELQDGGPPCYCGKRGCIETWLSGPGFAADHFRLSNQRLSTTDIIAAAHSGDAAARLSIARYHDRLARALATVINIVDPHVVVLGGGMSNMPDIVHELEQRLPAYVFSDSVATRILMNRHGDSSGVRGAAWLWPIAYAQ